jgi:hypothetical protein
MSAELGHVVGKRARLQFGLGCVWAAAVICARSAIARPAHGTAFIRVFVLAGVGAAIGLGAYGLVRYPGLRSGFNPWASVGLLVALLVVYVVSALVLSSDWSSEAAVARQYGMAGGVAIGVAWLAMLFPPWGLRAWVGVPLLVALFVPAGIAVFAARSTGNARAGSRAACWAGLVGGLVVFVVWVTMTYVRAGGPYDPGLIRDFQRSGARDLATYAVSDDLGSGLVLLVLVPLVALALGSLTARLTGRSPRTLTARD